MDLRTRLARGMAPPDHATPLAPTLYQTSVFAFENLREVDEVLSGAKMGYAYGRSDNPTVAAFAQHMADLEGAEQGTIVSSGNGALLASFLALLPQGGRILMAREIYGGSLAIGRGLLAPLGFTVRWIDSHDLDDVQRALAEGAGVVLLETISNPLGRVCDLPAIIAMAHDAGCPVVVDNTFATPYHARPHEYGADLVVHSLTKFIGGHSDLILGAVTGARQTMDVVHDKVSVAGLTADPFAVWLAARGARTLALRMERASANALVLAQALERHAAIDRVYYPGLVSHPDHALAQRILNSGNGAIVSVRVRGGLQAVERLIERLKLVVLAPSLGDTATTVSHPVIASHRELTAEEKAYVGIDEGIIRISVGIDEVRDIVADFEEALQ